MEIMEIMRDIANLPEEIPEAMLYRHIEIQEKEAKAYLGTEEIGEEIEEEYKEAVALLALSSVYPELHTLYIDNSVDVANAMADTSFVFNEPSAVLQYARRYERLGYKKLNRLRNKLGSVYVQII